MVRSHFGPMRACYEDGLRRDPKLTGRVAVRFVIERDGHVGDAHVDAESSSMPDPVAEECIAAAFAGIVSPPPNGGIITVVYPIVFAPE